MILSWLCCGKHAIAHYILLRPDGIAAEMHRELVSRGGVGPDVPLLMREVASQSLDHLIDRSNDGRFALCWGTARIRDLRRAVERE